MSPANYYIVQQLHTLAMFIEELDRLSDDIRSRVLKMLEYVVTVVNCVPVQELCSLSTVMQGTIDTVFGCV